MEDLRQREVAVADLLLLGVTLHAQERVVVELAEPIEGVEHLEASLGLEGDAVFFELARIVERTRRAGRRRLGAQDAAARCGKALRGSMARVRGVAPRVGRPVPCVGVAVRGERVHRWSFAEPLPGRLIRSADDDQPMFGQAHHGRRCIRRAQATSLAQIAHAQRSVHPQVDEVLLRRQRTRRGVGVVDPRRDTIVDGTRTQTLRKLPGWKTSAYRRTGPREK